MKSRGHHAIALLTYVKDHQMFDAVADGLRSAIEYDKTYFDKLTASLLPLMEKLTSGPVGNYCRRITLMPMLPAQSVIPCLPT